MAVRSLVSCVYKNVCVRYSLVLQGFIELGWLNHLVRVFGSMFVSLIAILPS